MKEFKHDDERLAALLGGRLEGPEREELLAHLLAHDEDYQVFADTAEILQEAENEEPAQSPEAGKQAHNAPVRPMVPPSFRGGARWRASRVIVPAVLAGLVVLGVFVTRRGAASAGNPVHLAAVLGADTRLSQTWITDRPGTGVRGGAERKPAEAGALLVDLAVSIQAGDVALTGTLAEQIRRRFDDRAVPGSPILQIIERADQPSSVLLPLVEQQTEQLSERLDSDRDRDYLQLGAWTEAARLAADRQDADFFRSGTTRTMLRRAARITRDNPAAQQALGAVRTSLETNGRRDWPTLQGQLRALMEAIVS